MPDLETRLRALRDDAAWPPTPDLAGVVVARLEREQAAPGEAERPASARRRGRWPGRRLAVAVALALLVPAAGALAFPSARDDVLEWLGVKGAEVRKQPRLPPARFPELAELGDPIDLADVEDRAGFRPLLAAELGTPRLVLHDPATDVVTLVHGTDDEPLLVAEVPGALERDLLQKIVPPGGEVRRVDVDGALGLYITGPPHAYLYLRPDGTVVSDRARLAGDTLVFGRGDLLIRIEGRELSLGRALGIAGSLE